MNYCNIPSNSIYAEDSNAIYYIRKNKGINGYPKCSDISGAKWDTYDINMDNIFRAMLSLFIISTLEGWPNYMYNFIDADDTGNHILTKFYYIDLI